MWNYLIASMCFDTYEKLQLLVSSLKLGTSIAIGFTLLAGPILTSYLIDKPLHPSLYHYS